ncbi:MAG: hypothetical protein VKK59_04385 [Vampirovibrionales bacterium]|nr:hypothetical protein [Vampirovibrionales bacterium]
MLRLIAKICHVIGVACLVLAPIAIVHWVIRLIHPPELMDFIALGNILILPPADMLDRLIPILPRIIFQEHLLSSSELILSFGLTVTFSVLYSFERFILDLDEKFKSNRIAKKMDKALKISHNQKNVILLKRHHDFNKFLVLIEYPFDQPGAISRYFDTFINFQANPITSGISRKTQHLLLDFNSAEKAVLYAMEASRNLLVYYATLRPAEPKPPFKIVLHAISSKTNFLDPTMTGACLQLIKYAKPNQVILSSNMKVTIDSMLINRTSHLKVKLESMGLYSTSNNETEEIFHLLSAKSA